MDMKCEGCVNAVKSKLQTIEGRFLRLFCFGYDFGKFILLFSFVMCKLHLIFERD